ncbi:MAG: 5'-methylthioadenosine/S-adenosylhomocysteine nucleosidase [Desulfobacterales bacterium]
MAKDIVTAIVMATMLEAKPFVQKMPLRQTRKAPFYLFQNHEILLLVSGIGKANAAMATAYCCLKFKPACVFNLGAAGATRSGYDLGEIFHIHKIVEPDRPDLRTGKPCGHQPDLLEGFKTAKLATSDRALLDPKERQTIAHSADLLDMEGASVVQTCKKFKTRCFLFKFVSDTPDHTRDQDIVDHIRGYRQRFYEFFAGAVIPNSRNYLM